MLSLISALAVCEGLQIQEASALSGEGASSVIADRCRSSGVFHLLAFILR